MPIAIQLARLSGFSPIITTASKHNADFVKALGATHVINRNTSLLDGARAITNQPIKVIYDAISEKDTQNESYNLLAPGGTIILVLPPQIDESKLTKDKDYVIVYGTVFDKNQRQLGVSLYKHLTALFESGELKVSGHLL